MPDAKKRRQDALEELSIEQQLARCQRREDELEQREREVDRREREVEARVRAVAGDARSSDNAAARDHEVRKAYIEELRASEQRFRDLYKNTPAILHSIDEKGRLLSVSQRWLDVLGYDEDEVLGRKSTDFLTEASREYAQTVVLPAYYKNGYCTDIEYQMVKKSGEVIDVLLSATSEPVGPSRFTRSLAVIHDVTEKNEFERQIRQAQKMDALGRFAGGMAHDFNNILTGILGAAELAALDLPRDHPVQQELEQILQIGARATALTKHLLAFSRQDIPDVKSLDLNRVVSSAMTMLGPLLREDVELTLDLEPDLERIDADEVQLEQVLFNLAVNAREAMPLGGRFTITTAMCDVDQAHRERVGLATVGRYVEMSVRDDGEGISAEVLPRIFEPFYTTKDQAGGTGLGLATVHSIVRRSGGVVTVDSKKGTGTTFVIYFPSGSGPADAPGEVGAEEREGETEAPSGDEAVLFIEDEDAIRQTYAQILERHGYRVLQANGAKMAAAVYGDHAGEIALILCDVIMPEKSGPELVTELTGTSKRCAVLYVSGYSDDQELRQGILRQDVDFLAKPFSRAALLRKVRDVIDDFAKASRL